MTLKSTIDWNEIVPMLPKAKRDDLYLEAVTILATGDNPPRPRTVSSRKLAPRLWRDTNDSGQLAQSNRVYKLNRGVKPCKYGKIAEVWTEILKRKSDTISYTEFKALGGNTAGMIGYLWAKRLIDIVESKT